MQAAAKDASQRDSGSRGAKRADAALARAALSPCDMLNRTLGNQGVQRLLRARQMQAKLAVSEPHDPLEQEADRVADEVMRMPEPAVGPADAISPRRPSSIQRRCSECEEELQREALAEEEEAPPIARKQENASSSHETSRTESLVSKLPGRGEPLPDSVRNFMEPRFGVDFSAVRVHTGPEAHRSTEEISALAYTAWNHIVFRAGQYDPLRESGKRLLAHELTHVLQQTRSRRARLDAWGWAGELDDCGRIARAKGGHGR